MPRGKRLKLDTGIYQDDIGFSLCVKIHGTQFEKRCQGQPDQALRQRWIAELTAQMPGSDVGTLAGDIKAYLLTFHGRRKEDARINLAPWIEALGDRTRHTITSMDLRAVLSRWQKDCAASTVNHRRQELLNVYKAVNGKAGANPVRDTPRVPERREEPRGIPPAIVRLILAELPPGKTRLRLNVLAATGLPHIQIGRLHARDFHQTERTLYVRPRRKGDGVAGRTIPLTSAATLAISALLRANATGRFSNSSVHKIFKKAVKRARAKWQKAHRRQAWPAPENLHPYDLRHAFLTEAYRRTRDLRAVAELGLHSDMRTTQRYAEAAVSETARAAIEAMDKAG